jgi:hypothetical protein
MLQKSQQAVNDALRRNIWRSLLIMRTATVSELLGVVRELSTRKTRTLLRELETHGYLGKSTRKGRPEYSQAVDSPSLPALCAHCNRPFSAKACSKKPSKTERQRETEARKIREEKPRTIGEVTGSPAIDLDEEVHHDAA